MFVQTFNVGGKARRKARYQLRLEQQGKEPDDFKPMPSVGSGVYEIRIHAQDAYRVFYVAKFEDAVYVFMRSKRKSKRRQGATSKSAGSVTAPKSAPRGSVKWRRSSSLRAVGN